VADSSQGWLYRLRGPRQQVLDLLAVLERDFTTTDRELEGASAGLVLGDAANWLPVTTLTPFGVEHQERLAAGQSRGEPGSGQGPARPSSPSSPGPAGGRGAQRGAANREDSGRLRFLAEDQAEVYLYLQWAALAPAMPNPTDLEKGKR
jgi:hypothetical protein